MDHEHEPTPAPGSTTATAPAALALPGASIAGAIHATGAAIVPAERRHRHRSLSLASASSLGSALGSLIGGHDFELEITLQPDGYEDGDDDGDGEVLLHWVDGQQRLPASASGSAAPASVALSARAATALGDRPGGRIIEALTRALGGVVAGDVAAAAMTMVRAPPSPPSLSPLSLLPPSGASPGVIPLSAHALFSPMSPLYPS